MRTADADPGKRSPSAEPSAEGRRLSVPVESAGPGMPHQIRMPLQWSSSCWMIWAVQPLKVFSRT